MKLNFDYSKYKSVIFDFDGVILDSNQAKTNAFRQALEGEDQSLVDEFIEYHCQYGGVSRFVKFTHFYKDMKKEYQESDISEALERFAHSAFQNVLKCKEIPNVLNFLEKLNQENIDCFIISGGVETELREIVRKRSLDCYFKEVLGCPATKLENFEKILSQLTAPYVFFGDANTDMNVAEEFNADFIFVSSFSEWKDGVEVCQDAGHPIISDYRDLIQEDV